jgi:hypothetical protein
MGSSSAFAAALALAARTPDHEGASEAVFGGKGVVRSTVERQVVSRRCAVCSVGHDVMQLDVDFAPARLVGPFPFVARLRRL